VHMFKGFMHIPFTPQNQEYTQSGFESGGAGSLEAEESQTQSPTKHI
jgi:hypothetical protein